MKPANALKSVERESTASGTRAMLFSQLLRLGLTTAGIAILSRMLAPADFGVFAVVTAILGVAGALGDLGLSLAAIREVTLDSEQFSGLFWINTGFGFLQTIAVCALSPLVADAVGMIGVRPLLIAVSPVFVLGGAAVQYRVELARTGRFASLAAVETIGPAAGLLAAMLVASGRYGPWALVAQQTTTSLVVLFLLLLAVRRFPGRPRKVTGISRIARAGGIFTFAQLVSAATTSAGPLFLGRFSNENSLGAYSRGTSLVKLPQVQFAAALTRVVVPRLAASTESSLFESRLHIARSAYGYSIGLFVAFIGGMAAPIVQIALGDQWLIETPNVVRVLAIGMIAQIFSYVFYWGLVAAGKMRVFLQVDLPASLVTLLILPFVSRLGPIAAAAAYSTGMVVRAILSIQISTKALKVSKPNFLKSMMANCVLVLVVYVGCTLVSSVHAIQQPIIMIAIGVFWMIASTYLCSAVNRRIRDDLVTALIVYSRVIGIPTRTIRVVLDRLGLGDSRPGWLGKGEPAEH